MLKVKINSLLIKTIHNSNNVIHFPTIQDKIILSKLEIQGFKS